MTSSPGASLKTHTLSGEGREIFTKLYIAAASTCCQTRNFTIMRLRSSFTFMQVERQLCIRWFCCFCSRLACFYFGREKVEIPGAPCSLMAMIYLTTTIFELKRKSILKKDFLPLWHVEPLDGFDSSLACVLLDRPLNT